MYDLVASADGINSEVRRLAFGGPEPAYAGQMAWRSLARYARTRWTAFSSGWVRTGSLGYARRATG